MTATTSTINGNTWSTRQLLLFRIAFIFLLLLTVPLDPGYWKQLFNTPLFHLHFQDLFLITAYVPRIVHFSDWGLASFAGWGIALILAVVGAVIWGAVEKREIKNYDQLYYVLRVIVRYRLALALIGYGVIKLFPVQIPYPTLSDLHTAYGDFLPWKIYYLSTGVSTAGYEPTLGAIEILAAILLLWRRTAVIGAGLAAALLINIVLANFAYQLGDHVYSVYLLLLSAVILAYDTPRLYDLLVKERAAKADHFQPVYPFKQGPKVRYALKGLFGLFLIAYLALTFSGSKNSSWPYPDTPGLADAYGYYNVREFTVNHHSLPYSATDSTRWADVVFEKFNVLSIHANNKHYPVDLSSPTLRYQPDGFRGYLEKGNGGRAFYRYTVDGQNIRLANTNTPGDVESFSITRPDPSTIILNGFTTNRDTLQVVLDKVNKEYLLYKGRRKPVTVN